MKRTRVPTPQTQVLKPRRLVSADDRLHAAPAAANKKKADDTAREKDMAFEQFERVPLDVLARQHTAQTHLKQIASIIATELGRRESAVRRRVGTLRKEFLKTKKQLPLRA